MVPGLAAGARGPYQYGAGLQRVNGRNPFGVRSTGSYLVYYYYIILYYIISYYILYYMVLTLNLSALVYFVSVL